MKTVIVTGASRGIGAAICRNLRTKDIHVIGVARSADVLHQLSMEKLGPGTMEFVSGDVCDPSTVQQAIEFATRNGNALEALILNAGTLGPIEKLRHVDPTESAAAFNVNVVGNLLWIHGALPHLCKSRGRIIMTTSGVANRPYAGFSAYCASKAALNVLASVLALEEPDLTVLAVDPGIVDTDMYKNFLGKGRRFMAPSQVAFLEDLAKSGTITQPEVVAEAYARLALYAPHSESGKVVKWNDSWIKTLAQ